MGEKTRIIGLRGKKGVGKNYVGDIIANLAADRKLFADQAALADPLKEFCINVLGLTRKQCYGSDAEKNSASPYLWSQMPQFVRDKYPGKTSGYMTARHVLQVFGTEFMRDCFSDRIWIDSLHRRIAASSADIFVVTDVRFENECHAILDWGGKVWQITGPQRGEDFAKHDMHASETDMDKEFQADSIIYNGYDQTPESLRRQVEDALDSVVN